MFNYRIDKDTSVIKKKTRYTKNTLTKLARSGPGPGAHSNANSVNYNVVEQTTERVNILDPTKRPEYAPAQSALTKRDKIKALKTFLMSGKKFSEAIKKC